jgi:perosamine synthetase
MIPIFKPFMPKGIISEIEDILYSGNLAFGKYGKLFEQELSKYISNDRVLSVSSYNHAMMIVISALDLQPGDEIIASPVSCLASNQPFVAKNIKVIWADINPLTGSICPDDVVRRITSKTKAIFHNHFCGYLGDIESVNAIAKEYGLFVVDDCIEAFGAEYNGVKVGNLSSDISVFSFQTVRLPNTIDGGAISFKNEQLFEKAKKIRDYGIDRKNFRDSLGEINGDCDIEIEGYGALMSEVNSYIGIEQMKYIQNLLGKQQANALMWNEKIQDLKGITPLSLNKNSRPNYWIYGVLCTNKIEALESFRIDGWYASSVHINNNIYSVFKNKEELKGVNQFMNSFLALPSGWWI